MAIDIRNIDEITFTQSIRGYNTDEVDDFLDALYEEALKNNKEFDELKKKIEDLESNAGNSGPSAEDSYSVIANAQEEADRIIENARLKAHAMIESAENAQMESVSVPTVGVSANAVNRLKDAVNEMYKKQMAIIEGLSVNEAEEAEAESSYDDIPSVSFEGLTKQRVGQIPAERDIIGEISSIGFGGIEAPPIMPQQEVFQDTEEDSQEEPEGLAFAFAEHNEIKEEKIAEEVSYRENAPEDPDDIIAQILRDNNRN